MAHQLVDAFLDLPCRIQNTNIPRAGRGGAANGEAARRGGAGQDGTPTGRFAQEKTVLFVAFQGIVDNCPERLFGSTEKRTPM